MNYNDIEPFVCYPTATRINTRLFGSLDDKSLSLPIRDLKQDLERRFDERIFIVGSSRSFDIITSIVTIDRNLNLYFSIGLQCILHETTAMETMDNYLDRSYSEDDSVEYFIFRMYSQANGDFQKIYDSLWLYML